MSEATVYQTPDDIPENALIRGTLVTLRPVTYADTEDILRWRNAKSVRDHFVFRNPLTKQMHETWLKEQVAAGRVVQWVICVPDDGALCPVGSVYLRDIDPEEQTAEYGIFIGVENARGKGFATEAARLVLRYAFDERKLAGVGLRVYSDNEQAKKGYLAAGFREVRTMPAVESSDGTRADMIWMEARPGI